MTWRRSVTRALADYRWYIMGIAWLVAFTLGCRGYWELYPKARPLDVGYWSLKLFLGGAPARPDLPLSLDIAQFLAVIVTGWAGLSGLRLLFRDRFQQMRIPLMRGHVVVCGLGYVGAVFVRHLHDAGVRVVAVESNAANPHIELCRSLGMAVIVGDAQLRRTLQATGVERAGRLLAVTPNDAVNTEIVSVARQLAAERSRGELYCLARIGDPDFCALLRVQETRGINAASKLDFFNTDEISARLLLDEYPVTHDEGRRPHILVADLDVLGRWLVRHAARDWYETRGDHATPLLVTVVDDDAEQRVRSLLGRHPALEKVCEFITVEASVRGVHELPKHHARVAAPPITRAYVTAHRDEQALEIALKIRHHLHAAIPLVVALSRTYGVARLLAEVKSSEGLNIDVFPTLDRICTVEFIRGGSFETIARAIHDRYRAEQLAAGNDEPMWQQLDAGLKDDNRDQARHIAVKLRSIGCEIAPLDDWDAPEFQFTPGEVETLAIAEHDRWCRVRIAAGWTLGKKDREHKVTPYLVPFAELPSDIAEYDRIFVREIPALLASVGLQVIRVRELTG